MTPVQGEELLNEALEGNKWAAISAAYNLGFQRGAKEKSRQKKAAKH